MQFPKVLIFGQPFNDFSGGGITLTNLFKGWPKDKIAVTFIGHGLINVTTDVCDTYYQLGEEEHKWIFPFNLIQRKFPSGLKTFGDAPPLQVNSIQIGLRYQLVNQIFYPFLRWIGLFHMASRISMSQKLRIWLKEYNPDVLYLQASTREGILFSLELCDYLNIPSVIHVMDDWPSTIGNRGLFKKFWYRRVNNEFSNLISKVNLHLSICDAMSEEYLKRYNKTFIPFHNPIDIDRWMPTIKTDFSIDIRHITLLYSGRIGDNGIADSLVEIASALEQMGNDEMSVKLSIQTPTKTKSILEALKKFSCVEINPYANYEQIPGILSSADILILANDFSIQGINYLKFSMPTKTSEYMISGTPVLVYASDSTAVSGFFTRNDCGYCVTKQSKEEIISAIRFLVKNEDYRMKISRKAVELAKERFNAQKVRDEFQSLVRELSEKYSANIT